MAKQTINIGSAANDGTGSTLRESFDITNDNFTELYGGTGGLFHKIEGTNFTGSLLIGHTTTGTLSSAQNNTGIGISALDALTSGDNNVAVGKSAGSSITTGSYNVLLGRSAGISLSTGSENIAIGFAALSLEDGNGKNIAIGTNALEDLNAGADAYNIAIGHDAGRNVTTGVRNTLIGAEAGDALTTGQFNVAVGYAALSTEDDSGFNTAIGYGALRSQNASGTGNNVAVGKDAGTNVTTGINNTIIGALAGDALQTGSNNTLIGKNAAASAVDVSNEITFGDSNITNVRIPSDSTLKIGASSDLQLEHLSGNSFIKNTAVGDLYIENQVDDADVIFRCDDGSGGLETYFFLDGSISAGNPYTVFPDNSSLAFGNLAGGDIRIIHNGTDSFFDNNTGDIYFRQDANDKDIIFQSDDGSGGLATYFQLDGSDGFTKAHKKIRFLDNAKATFGNVDDLEIFHDGSNTKIVNITGDLKIGVANTLAIQNNAYDENIASFTKNGAVSLYYDNSSKLETTSTGIAVTGNADVSSSVLVGGADSIFAENNIRFKSAGAAYIDHNTTGQSFIFRTSTSSSLDTTALTLTNAGNATFAGDVLVEDNLYLTDAGTVRGKIQLNSSDRDDLDIKVVSLGSNMKFFTVDTERMRIDSSGNVGIGTASPSASLDIKSDGADFFLQSADYKIARIQPRGTGADLDKGLFSLFDGSTEDVRIDTEGNSWFKGGNIGIGTDSPGALLHLANTSGGPIYIEDTDATNTFDITSISNGGGNFSLDTRRTSDNGFVSTDYQIVKDASGANYHRWLTQGSERMRINNSGYIYVNTGGAEPSATQVGVRITGTQGQAFWNSATSATTGYNHFNFYNPNGAVGSIVTNGSATAFNTSSDYRLKKDLKDFDGLDKVSKIPVYDFKWKVDDSSSYGVMAHELQEVLPDAVSGEKDGEEMQGVDYSKIVPLLIKSIQELEARVKTLENK